MLHTQCRTKWQITLVANVVVSAEHDLCFDQRGEMLLVDLELSITVFFISKNKIYEKKIK